MNLKLDLVFDLEKHNDVFFIIGHDNVDDIKSGLDLLPLGHIDKLVSVFVKTSRSSPFKLLWVVKVDESPR